MHIMSPRPSSGQKALQVEWHALRKQGWTLQQIADEYGVSKQAVQQKLKRHGLDVPRP